jgi:hypothetical protein
VAAVGSATGTTSARRATFRVVGGIKGMSDHSEAEKK